MSHALTPVLSESDLNAAETEMLSALYAAHFNDVPSALAALVRDFPAATPTERDRAAKVYAQSRLSGGASYIVGTRTPAEWGSL